jgi:hypothetical protein
VENAEEVSRDREKWKEFVVAAVDLNGLSEALEEEEEEKDIN